MNNDTMLGSVYILLAMLLVGGALVARRERPAKLLVMALAWMAIFAGGFVVFTFRDDLGYVFQRLRSEATGDPVATGDEIRVPMAIDGHFWIEGRINGEPVQFLVDSGATMTTIGRGTAVRAGVQIDPARTQLVRTGNGVIRVSSVRAETLNVGPIERQNVRMHVADTEDLNVLGMNFLSSLDRWGVEGRWLILNP